MPAGQERPRPAGAFSAAVASFRKNAITGEHMCASTDEGRGWAEVLADDPAAAAVSVGIYCLARSPSGGALSCRCTSNRWLAQVATRPGTM